MSVPDIVKSSGVNANTTLSLGVVVLLIMLLNSINGFKTETSLRFQTLETKVSSIESRKDLWSSTDMFRWAVHLQQSNPTIKVPEPDKKSE